MSANDVQHGGDHYTKRAIQPWDFVHRNGIGYLEGNAIKYLARWKDKNGLEDLKKAKHYVQKLIEEEFGIVDAPLRDDRCFMGLTGSTSDVAIERVEQIRRWGSAHDDEHTEAQMVSAALCYLLRYMGLPYEASLWPWEDPNKPAEVNQRRGLVIAAALVIAEIDRIDRVEAAQQPVASELHPK